MIPLDPFHTETDPGAVVDDGGTGAEEQQGGISPELFESPEFQQAVAEQAARASEQSVMNLLASLDNGQSAPEFDPFAENSAEQIRAMIRAEMQPFQQFTEEARYDEGESRALDIIASLESDGGEFLGKAGEGEQLEVDSRAIARNLGDMFYPAAAERYGEGPRAAEHALSQAVEMVRALEQTIGKAYLSREQNQLHTLASARREPSATGQNGAIEAPARAGSEQELVRRFFPM